MSFKIDFSKKGILLLLTCPESLWVKAEKTSLTMSVINNILSNAIKFSNINGSIEVEALDLDDKVRLVITDHGIGMGPELLKNIFSKSVKTTRPGTLKESGTGFGMPIVKKFMELYEGEIEILSQSIEKFPEECGTKVILNFQKP